MFKLKTKTGIVQFLTGAVLSGVILGFFFLASRPMFLQNSESHLEAVEEVINENEPEKGAEFNIGLQPLMRQNTMRERDIRGDWVGSAEVGTAFGFQFFETEEFGPYTVVEIWGQIEDEEGIRDISRVGFYEITPEGNLRLIFRNRVYFETGAVEAISEEEIWTITTDEVFITLSNGDVQISMTRWEIQN